MSNKIIEVQNIKINVVNINDNDFYKNREWLWKNGSGSKKRVKS